MSLFRGLLPMLKLRSIPAPPSGSQRIASLSLQRRPHHEREKTILDFACPIYLKPSTALCPQFNAQPTVTRSLGLRILIGGTISFTCWSYRLARSAPPTY